MKHAVYMGTRNLYPVMLPPVRSLLANSEVDHVWLLTEDDAFPYPLPDPDRVHVINVSSQPYFRHDGPNYHRKWTYMVLLKTALPKLFPSVDRILCLDVDTFIVKNIDELWSMWMDEYYLAAVHDTGKNDPEYYNAGVMMMNLDKLRQDHMDDRLIDVLNRIPFEFCEQEAISLYCKGHIKRLPGNYNASSWTDKADDPKIIHYAAIRNWTDQPEYRRWCN